MCVSASVTESVSSSVVTSIELKLRLSLAQLELRRLANDSDPKDATVIRYAATVLNLVRRGVAKPAH